MLHFPRPPGASPRLSRHNHRPCLPGLRSQSGRCPSRSHNRNWFQHRLRFPRFGIIDDGVEYTHPDLDANYDTTLDYDSRGTFPAPESQPDDDAYTSASTDRHGTTVAGVIGAELDNVIGGAGVGAALIICAIAGCFGGDDEDGGDDGADGNDGLTSGDGNDGT